MRRLLLMMLLLPAVVSASIADQLLAVNAAKQAIKAAIQAKGISTTGVDFADYGTLIADIVMPNASQTLTISGEAQEEIVAGDIVSADGDNKISKFENPFDGLFPGDIEYFGYAAEDGSASDTIDMIAILWRTTSVDDDFVEDTDASIASTAFLYDVAAVDATSDGSRVAVSQYDWGTASIQLFDEQGDDTYAQDILLPTASNNPGYTCAISDDKSAIVLAHLGDSGATQMTTWYWNGSAYASATISVNDATYWYTRFMDLNADGTRLAVGISDGTRLSYYERSGATWSAVAISNPTGSNAVYPAFIKDSNQWLICGVNDGQRAEWYKYVTSAYVSEGDYTDLPNYSATFKPVIAKDASPQRIITNNSCVYEYNSGDDNWDKTQVIAGANNATSWAVSDDGSILAVAVGKTVSIYEWDGDSYEAKQYEFVSHTENLYLDMTGDGQTLFIAGEDFGMKVYRRTAP